MKRSERAYSIKGSTLYIFYSFLDHSYMYWLFWVHRQKMTIQCKYAAIFLKSCNKKVQLIQTCIRSSTWWIKNYNNWNILDPPLATLMIMWSQWGKWSDCSVTCGGAGMGYLSRTRTCSVPHSCVGLSTEYAACATLPTCPSKSLTVIIHSRKQVRYYSHTTEI